MVVMALMYGVEAGSDLALVNAVLNTVLNALDVRIYKYR